MDNSLSHHGVKGQKWGVRRYQDKSGKRTALGKARYSKTSPRKELDNGDYLYKKGTVVGRFGGDDKWDQDNDVTYLYTNEKDRSVYNKRFGGDELTYKFKKDVKMPNLQKQYTDLLEFVKNDDAVKDQYDYVLNEPFDFWKDNINQGGKVADRYYSSMKNKGYDALIDFRNVGMTDDPIIILSPKDSLESIKDEIHHSEQEVSKMNQAEYLCHSSGPWKKHKYFQKIGEGANAVYRYAKKKGAEIADAAGVDEREEYLKRKKISDRYEKDLEEHGYDPMDKNSGRNDTFDKYVNLGDPHDKAIKDWTNWQNNSDRWKEMGSKLQSRSYAANEKTRKAASDYYKTPLGRVELSDPVQALKKKKKRIAHDGFGGDTTIEKGQARIDKLFGKN